MCVVSCNITRSALWHNMEARLRISFLLNYRLTVKLFTLFVESGLGQHAIGFLKSCLGILSRLVLLGPSACFHLERSVIQTNKSKTTSKMYTFLKLAEWVTLQRLLLGVIPYKHDKSTLDIAFFILE